MQPERNIALTRNRTVSLADGDWLAFIDDDERAPESWLQQLLEAATAHGADGVLAPVEPRLLIKALWTTLLSLLVFGLLIGVMLLMR